MKARLYSLAAMGLILGIGGSAQAAVLTLNFDAIVSGDTPVGTNIATLTITDTSTNNVHVKLSHNATSAAGQFITELYMNLDPFVTVTQTNRSPVNKFSGSIQQSLNNQGTAGLNFDLQQSFVQAGSSGGVNRLKPGEAADFDLSGAGLDAMDFNFEAIPTGGQRTDIKAMIHLQGIPGANSVKLGAVPEPGSIIAVGLGLVGLIARRRRA